MEVFIESAVTRLSLWLIRTLVLPAIVILVIAYVIIPAVTVIAQALLSPVGLILIALVLWWRRR